jgi:hypothetical protein
MTRRKRKEYKSPGILVYTMCMEERMPIELLSKMIQKILVEHRSFKPLYLDGFQVSHINLNFNNASKNYIIIDNHPLYQL